MFQVPRTGNWSEKCKEVSQNSFGITYTATSVALESAVMDLHIGITISINSSALEIACPTPGIGAKI
jgi:hypothetical protein